MSAIWKFQLPIEDNITLRMPEGARPLSVGVQSDGPVLWALVDPGNPVVDHRFRLFGTGHRVEGDGGQFVGTFQLQLPGGEFVGHLFAKSDT